MTGIPGSKGPSTHLCKIDGCDRQMKHRGWCLAHYKRWYKYGDPLASGRRPVSEEFWSRVQKTDTCWNWVGHVVAHGYGRFNCSRLNLGTYYVHRQVFHFMGLRKPGSDEVVDHLCHNRTCVNPAHLRITDERSNHENLRGPRAGSKSGRRGVTVYKSPQGWTGYQAWYYEGGKSHHIGTYQDLEEAAEVADRARMHLYSVPGVLNKDVTRSGAH